MDRSAEPYIPRTIGEIWDMLGSMTLSAPTFLDKTGYFPNRNIHTEFRALNEGLKVVRKRVGEENYQRLVVLSDRMRAYFELDPEDKTEDGNKGRDCIYEMEEILKSVTRKSAKS